ncbi:hypothetical protein [Nocardia sp. NBC_01388]|uniref:hypothetical protein n=1 Tax=Nocardia sp. NBC_01388 TaxID=2903596 RepID=UPI0032459052
MIRSDTADLLHLCGIPLLGDDDSLYLPSADSPNWIVQPITRTPLPRIGYMMMPVEVGRNAEQSERAQ